MPIPGRGAIVAAAVLAGLVTGCGDASPSTTASAPTTLPGRPSPTEAADAWFAAVGGGRAAEATGLLVDGQLPILIAVENDLDAEQLAGLLADGVPGTAQQDYWDSFAAGFEEFAEPIENLSVTAVDEFGIDGRTYAAAVVGLAPGAGSTRFITTDVGGRWRIDLLATLAPALVNQLRSLATAVAPEPAGETAREALVAQIPSLRAAVEQPDPGADAAVLRELEALIRFLAPAFEG